MSRIVIIYLFFHLMVLTSVSLSMGQTNDEFQYQHDTITDTKAKVQLLCRLFLQYEFSDTSKAHEYLELALKTAFENGDNEGLALTYMYIGYFKEDQGNYSGAYTNYQRSLQQYGRLKDKKGIASSYNSLGNILLQQGNYLTAVENYQKALGLAEELGDKNLISKYITNIGSIYLYLHKNELAIEYYTRSIEIARELKNLQREADCLNNLGIIYRQTKKYTEALEAQNRSLEITSLLNDEKGIASCFQNFGVIYAAMSDSFPNFREKILVNYKKALEMYIKIGDKKQQSICLYNMALHYKEEKMYDLAIEMGEQSLDISVELGAIDDMNKTYWVLSDCYMETGSYKEAYENHVGHKKMFDSVNNNESIKRITQLEMQNEFEKVQKEMEFEQQKKDLLKEEEIKSQKIIRNILSVGVFLLIILLFLIFRGYKMKQKKNVLLAEQKEVIELKNREITDSIRYAKHIQEAILPSDTAVYNVLPDAFVFYQPKDIVSGDFYWVIEKEKKIFFAVVDCTGHGVPGAFISIVGHGGLNRAINEFGLRQPAAILDKLNDIVNDTLRQTYAESTIRDGMDIALCCIDKEKRLLEFAGAYNSLYLIRNKQIIEYKADHRPIGHFIEDVMQPFTNREIQIEKGDVIYIFTDGFVDQFGGGDDHERSEGGQKFKFARFRNLLLSISEEPMGKQQTALQSAINKWKGKLEQVDDICIIGVRIG